MSAVARPHWLFWLAILSGMTLLGVIACSSAAYVAWRATVPLPFPHLAYRALFAAALAAHLAEGAYAYRLAASSAEAPLAGAWGVQTLPLGYPSLRLLRSRLDERAGS